MTKTIHTRPNRGTIFKSRLEPELYQPLVELQGHPALALKRQKLRPSLSLLIRRALYRYLDDVAKMDAAQLEAENTALLRLS